MGDTFSTEHASVITKDFPVVVIRETGELSDDERVQVLDQIDELLDAGKPHALILDLTASSGLSESQAMFLSEALQLREDQISATWISVAVLVTDTKSELATFWQKASGAPTQAFTNMMSAVVWTRQALDKRTASNSGEVAVNDRRSRTTDAGGRRSEASARLSDPPERKKESSKDPKAEKPKDLKAWLRTRSGKSVASLTGALALIWLLGPSGAMSWFDAARFSQQKNELQVRVFSAAKGKDTRILPGQTCAANLPIRFEADLPSNAYLMLMGVSKTGQAYAAWPKASGRSAGPILRGKGVRLPALIELDPTTKDEWFHFVACPDRINATDCSAEKKGATLDCPSSCLVSSFHVNKAADSK